MTTRGVVFCLPGSSFSGVFLERWTQLLVECGKRGVAAMLSRREDAVVHFARAKCLGGDTLRGRGQLPFGGRLAYDAVMWIDSDMVFEPDDFFRLLESPHDVTCGLYRMRDGAYPVVVDWDTAHFAEHGRFRFLDAAAADAARATGTRYLPVAYAGMGWMLVRRAALDAIEYPWFDAEPLRVGDLVEMCSEDVAFCRKLAAAGHQVHVDLGVLVGHLKLMVL